jgi:hypothetical protein
MKINRGYVARLLAATDAAEALAELSSLWSTRAKVDGRPTAQWSRLKAGYSDDLGTGSR